MMFTLDSTTFDVLAHSRFQAPVTCRSTMRVRRFGNEPLRAWLKRPRQMVMTDAVNNMLRQIPDLLDAELTAALHAYQEGADNA